MVAQLFVADDALKESALDQMGKIGDPGMGCLEHMKAVEQKDKTLFF